MPESPDSVTSVNPLAQFIRNVVIRRLLGGILLGNGIVVAIWAIILAASLLMGFVGVDRWGREVIAVEVQQAAYYSFLGHGRTPAAIGVDVANAAVEVPDRVPVGFPKTVETGTVVARLIDSIGAWMKAASECILYTFASTAHLTIVLAVARIIPTLQIILAGLPFLAAAWYLGASRSRKAIEDGYAPNPPAASALLNGLWIIPSLLSLCLTIPLPFPYLGIVGIAIVATAITALLLFNFRRAMFFG